MQGELNSLSYPIYILYELGFYFVCSACQWLTALLVIYLTIDLTNEIKLCLISVKYQIVIFNDWFQ